MPVENHQTSRDAVLLDNELGDHGLPKDRNLPLVLVQLQAREFCVIDRDGIERDEVGRRVRVLIRGIAKSCLHTAQPFVGVLLVMRISIFLFKYKPISFDTLESEGLGKEWVSRVRMELATKKLDMLGRLECTLSGALEQVRHLTKDKPGVDHGTWAAVEEIRDNLNPGVQAFVVQDKGCQLIQSLAGPMEVSMRYIN